MTKSIGFYSFRYGLYYVLVIAAIFAAIYALKTFAPDLAASLHGGGSSGVGAVSIILPPMMVAQAFYRHESRAMTRGEGWSMAVIFTILAFVLTAGMMYAGTLIQPLSTYELSELQYLLNEERNMLLIVVAVGAVFLLLTNRLMLWAGVRGELKKAEKIAARKASKG